MKKEEKKDSGRPEAYPKPSTADNQLKDQPEFIDNNPNEFEKTGSGEGMRSNEDEPSVYRNNEGDR